MSEELSEKILSDQAGLADQENALKDPCLAYLFVLRVGGADIEKCQEAACKDPMWACYFVRYVPGADVGICQEAACKDPYWAFSFVRDVPGADIGMSLKACKGTKYEDKLNEYVMEKALI